MVKLATRFSVMAHEPWPRDLIWASTFDMYDICDVKTIVNELAHESYEQT